MDDLFDTKSFYERILQSHYKNMKLKVLEFSKESATSKGDNFFSEIYRILVKYTHNEDTKANKNEEISLILKIKITNLTIKTEVIDKVFHTEAKVFKDILPKIENYVGSKVAPFLFYVDEKSNYIVMEDLARSKYATGDTLKGLTFAQCHKSIEKMAKFHAGSVLIAETVDFQVVTYTSPAIDLHQFFSMCPELDLKEDKDEHFLDMYLKILTETMKKISCKTKPPKKEELKEAMKKRSVHSVVTGLVCYPRLQADKEDIESFAEALAEGKTKVDLFKNPLAVKTIQKFSRIINNKGYLD